jgi:hypothetical protein
MIVALPCIHFSVREREIINEHGFLSFPQFLDNHYILEGKASVKWLEKNIRKYWNLVRFAIAPDHQYDEMNRLKAEYPDINWIYPLHSKREDFGSFEWIGFPHDKKKRDYGLKTFLKMTEGKKRWYLGFWDVKHPERLQLFDGFDTTIPETYSGKFGRLWLDWERSCEVRGLLPTIEIFEFNVISFKFAVLRLLRTNLRTLETFGGT